MKVSRKGGLRVLGPLTLVGLAVAGLVGVAPVAGAAPSVSGGGPDRQFDVTTVSTRADMVTGGDVLLRIDVPRNVPMDKVSVTVEGRDVTDAFRAGEQPRALLGLVDGLELGDNEVVVQANGGGHGRPSTQLTVSNHPITGPVFSGPHQTPFICETDAFELGTPLDEHCSANSRVQYYYRSTTDGTFKPFVPDSPPPDDLDHTTTTEGHTVDFIVRVETGTINRAVYQTAFLHDPGTPLPDAWTDTRGWNHRLVYAFGGGLRASYHQGRWITGGSGGKVGAGLLDDTFLGLVDNALARGYALASSSLNVLNNVGNDVLSAETAMLVKERFVEQFGPDLWTMGFGCSGGSIQQYLIAENYPGILDGIIPSCSFPDILTASTTFTDCELLDHAFATSKQPLTERQKAAIVGHRTYDYCRNSLRSARVHASTTCDPAIPQELIYDPMKNPTGARCTLWDNMINIYGRDSATGFARSAFDNVGVQYGLEAFNSGAISAEQFVELNERVGGHDQDGNFASARTVGNKDGLEIAYRTGRINSGAGGLSSVPIIDYRGYADAVGDVHDAVRTQVMEARLVEANGHADNQAIWTTPGPSLRDPERFADSIRVMADWLDNIAADTSDDPAAVQVVENRPDDAVDACWTESGARITNHAVCLELYPPQGNPRLAAGAPVTDDVLKCALKPVSAGDYGQPLAAGQLERLNDVFPGGVCDFSRPGIGQQPLEGTWLRFE